MEPEKHHIIPYRTYIYILLVLITLTLLSVAVTSIELKTLTVLAALFFASVKSFLVLSYFMHLKFDQKIFAVMASGIILLIFIVILITFLDYYFR